MKVGDAATALSLAALLNEAVAAVGILRDHNKSVRFEAGLALECWADQVIVLVLRWHAFAALALDLGVKTARADAKGNSLARTWEQLPRVFGDQDPGLPNIFAAKSMTIGGTGNTHL